jgi:hypothetical protein
MEINESELVSNFIQHNKNKLPLFYENLTVIPKNYANSPTKLLNYNDNNDDFVVVDTLYKPCSSILIGLVNE